MRKEGLTFKDVKAMLMDIATRIPDSDEACEKYTVSYAPADCYERKGVGRLPESTVLTARLHNLSIHLKVEDYGPLSEYEQEGGAL